MYSSIQFRDNSVKEKLFIFIFTAFNMYFLLFSTKLDKNLNLLEKKNLL